MKTQTELLPEPEFKFLYIPEDAFTDLLDNVENLIKYSKECQEASLLTFGEVSDLDE